MFRDREKALQALQKQLLEEEEAEEASEETDDLPQEVYDEYAPELRAYNSDKADTDLEDYSDAVYDPPHPRTGCLLWFVLLTAAVLLVISWYLAKQGGLL